MQNGTERGVSKHIKVIKVLKSFRLLRDSSVCKLKIFVSQKEVCFLLVPYKSLQKCFKTTNKNTFESESFELSNNSSVVG